MRRFTIAWIYGVSALLLASAQPLFPSPAFAQNYPSKPIRVVLELASGAGGDVYMRVIAGQLSAIMGQPLVMDNRPGGGGVLAAETVIRSAPDGYTLLVATPNTTIIREFLSKSNTVHLRDLTPIAPLWDTPSLVMVSTSFPARNVRELIVYAKANPGKVAYGTVGGGSYHRLNAEHIQKLTGIELRNIPYKAGAQANTDLVGGEIPMAIGIAASADSFLKTGKIRVLATIEKKEADFPGVPVLSEVIPGFSPAPSWVGLFAPAKLPDSIQRRLNTDVNKALATPEVRSRQFFDPMGGTLEQFRARIQKDTALVAKIVKDANIQPTED